MPCTLLFSRELCSNRIKEKHSTILYKIIGERNSLSIYKAQKAWQLYYKSESDFINGALVGYVNFSKYGQCREVMIDDASRTYQMIKDRILTIKRLYRDDDN